MFKLFAKIALPALIGMMIIIFAQMMFSQINAATACAFQPGTTACSNR